MRKITLFLLMAVCVVVLLTTESCEGKRKTDVGEEGEQAGDDKPMRRGRFHRERRPGNDDEQPGERGNGHAYGRRHRHHGKDKNNTKPRDENSESSSGSED